MSMGGAQSGTGHLEDQVRKMTMSLMEKCKKRMEGKDMSQLEHGVSDGLRRRHGL